MGNMPCGTISEIFPSQLNTFNLLQDPAEQFPHVDFELVSRVVHPLPVVQPVQAIKLFSCG
jgi:hypothetical protein